VVHATLGIRPPARKEELGSDSQDHMDHQTDPVRPKLTLS